MIKPLVSIALCTYNGVNYLEEQIDSIAKQTYPNLELIIVDDCSSDNTWDLIQRLAARYPIIKAVQNSQNLGFNANFQKAISLTTGEFIAISDQDDVWLPNKIEILVRHIGNSWLIFSNSSYINEKGETVTGQLLTNFEFKNRDFKSLLLYNFVTGHTSLFARSFIDYIFPIPSQGYYDWWMGFVSLYHHKLAYINHCLTKHRIHQDSVMSTHAKVAKTKEYQQFGEVSNNLFIIKNYPDLNTDDQRWISDLYNAYSKRNTKGFNGRLVYIVFSAYAKLFPDLKKRGLFSTLNFALKFAKPLR